jgi:hypothetical protein
VFHRDYSKDKNCVGLKDKIDRLIWIHEKVADGGTVQRWKDNGVFADERDAGTTRTITVQTGFGPHQELRNFVDDGAPRIKTDALSDVEITIP